MPGPYDYSPFFAPPQPDGQGRGMSHVGSVLDAIMERREREKLERMQQEEAFRRAHMGEMGEAVRASMVESRERAKMAEAARHNAELEARAREAGERDERRIGIDAYGRAVPYLQEDKPQLAAPFLKGLRLGNDADSEFVNAPRLQLQAPSSIADMVPQPQAPSVPPPTGSPTFDAHVEGRKADREHRMRLTRELLTPLATDDIGKGVLEAAIAGGADQPAQERVKFFNEMVQAERNRRAANERSKNVRVMMTPDKRADNERGDVTAFEGAYAKWEAATNVDKLTDAYDKFREMSANTDNFTRDGSTIDLRSALYQTARYIVGPGVLTQPEYDNTVSKTSGFIGSALTKLKKNLDGEISPQEFDSLKKFVFNASAAIKQRGKASLRTFDKKFRGGYYDRTVPGEVARARAALTERLGIVEDTAPDDDELKKFEAGARK